MPDFPRIKRLPPYVFNITGELKMAARLVRAFIGLFFSYALTELIINRNLPLEMQEDAMDDRHDLPARHPGEVILNRRCL